MGVISRIFSRRCYGGIRIMRTLYNPGRENSSAVSSNSIESHKIMGLDDKQNSAHQKETISPKYRFIYPEFLPDPDPTYRNALREKLERMDMLARRTQIAIPEFYVGSVLAVTYSEPHAPGKVNKFVGLCIERKRAGLRSSFLLRNVVDFQGVEVLYELYDPAIQKIECLRLEKRLDPHLRYLRNAPQEYSTFPFDMEPEYLPDNSPVPVNNIKVKLNPLPWLERWELQELKGVETLQLSWKRSKKAKAAEKPWEKYDLMKRYRATIPEEEQNEIFNEVYTKLHQLEITRRRQKHKRVFVRPQKTG